VCESAWQRRWGDTNLEKLPNLNYLLVICLITTALPPPSSTHTQAGLVSPASLVFYLNKESTFLKPHLHCNQPLLTEAQCLLLISAPGEISHKKGKEEPMAECKFTAIGR
jgi:hypothetical protein